MRMHGSARIARGADEESDLHKDLRIQAMPAALVREEPAVSTRLRPLALAR